MDMQARTTSHVRTYRRWILSTRLAGICSLLDHPSPDVTDRYMYCTFNIVLLMFDSKNINSDFSVFKRVYCYKMLVYGVL